MQTWDNLVVNPSMSAAKKGKGGKRYFRVHFCGRGKEWSLDQSRDWTSLPRAELVVLEVENLELFHFLYHWSACLIENVYELNGTDMESATANCKNRLTHWILYPILASHSASGVVIITILWGATPRFRNALTSETIRIPVPNRRIFSSNFETMLLNGVWSFGLIELTSLHKWHIVPDELDGNFSINFRVQSEDVFWLRLFFAARKHCSFPFAFRQLVILLLTWSELWRPHPALVY